MATRILHTGDWHYGVHPLNIVKNGFNQRELDFYKSGDVIVDYAINEAKPDVFVLAGDTFHVTRPEPHTVSRLMRTLKRLTDAGIEVIIIGGNHDTPARPGKESPLLLVEEFLPIHLFLEQASKEIAGVKFHSLPYRTLSQNALVPFNYSKEIPNVFIGHATVPSHIIPSHIKDLVEIPVELVDAPEHVVSLLGHIHIHTKVTDKGYYCGSIEMINFGEIKNQPGIWLHDINDQNEVTSTSVKVSDMNDKHIPRRTFDIDLEVEGHENVDINTSVIEHLEKITPGSLVRLSLANADKALRNSTYINGWRKLAYEEKHCFHLEVKIQSKALDALSIIDENSDGEGISGVISLEQEWKTFLEEQNKIEFLDKGLRLIRGEQDDS